MDNVIDFRKALNFADAAPMPDTRIDAEAVAIWADVVFGYLGEGLVPLRGIAEKGGADVPPDLSWVPNDETLVEALTRFCARQDERKAAAFVIPALVAERHQAGYHHVTETGVVLVDIDHGDVKGTLDYLQSQLGAPITLIVNSGGITNDTNQENAHAYLRLTEGASGDDVKKVERVRSLLAEKLGTDPAMGKGKIAQPIRIPGGRWQKYGGDRPVTIREYNPTSEFDLDELLELVEAMPPMPGVRIVQQDSNPLSLDFSGAGVTPDRPVSETLTHEVREGGVDGITRFDALTQIIGYWIRRHHDGLVSAEQMVEEIRAYNSARVSPPWPEDRLEREFRALWSKHVAENGPAKPLKQKRVQSGFTSFSLGELLEDRSKMPDDLIEPRFLTPGGMAVIGGAPKVGKTKFVMDLLVHSAAGMRFMGLHAPRPLRIFYAQAELDYDYLRERVQKMGLDKHALQVASRNLFITPRFKGLLDEDGVALVVSEIKERFGNAGPDVIVIDPIRNVFDGGPDGGGENDAQAMMFFLQERAEAIREATNPGAGIILVHHTRKLAKKQLEEDPMQALAGSGALRGYYTTGMVIWKPDETRPERKIHFELRNGPGIEQKTVTLEDGTWREADDQYECIAGKANRDRWYQQFEQEAKFIIESIIDGAEKGEAYNATTFSQTFARLGPLGAPSSIRSKINELSAKGVIKFFDGSQVGLPKPANRAAGYLCVKDMVWGPSKRERIDPDTGEITEDGVTILPTHYKPPGTSGVLPVENPNIWVSEYI